jgi:ABC-type dipeptide/oligopeptide/nickel transport system permease subunit
MIRSYALCIMALMLGFSTTSAFLNTGILLKIVAQTETIIKQQSIVQNKTGLGFVENLDAMENSNINILFTEILQEIMSMLIKLHYR